jgi:hypothetical protein
MSEASNHSSETRIRGCAPDPEDFRLPRDARKLDAQIEAPAAQRIAEPTNLIRGENDKRNRLVLNCSKLRNGDLPFRQNLQQKRFEPFINFVDFIDQQDTGFLVEKRSQERALYEEIEGMERRPNLIPVRLQVIGLCFQE